MLLAAILRQNLLKLLSLEDAVNVRTLELNVLGCNDGQPESKNEHDVELTNFDQRYPHEPVTNHRNQLPQTAKACQFDLVSKYAMIRG